MVVADKAEGWVETQRRIAACRETRGERLDLSNLGLTRVPEGLTELDWLRELNLSENGIGEEGARALSGLVNLTTLDLSSNRIGDKDVQALLGLLNLTSLDLGGNQIGDRGVQALSGLLNLTSLDLSGNGSAKGVCRRCRAS